MKDSEPHEIRKTPSAISQSVEVLVMILDAEGRIVEFNSACESTTGYSKEEVVGSLICGTTSQIYLSIYPI